MKKTFRIALVLCLVVTMLCAVAMNANAEATVKKLDMMVGTSYAIVLEAADDGSVVTYTKNKEVDMNDGSADFKGWTQEIVTVTNEATDEWNTKFYYDATAGKWTLVLKGAKLDTYNNDTQTFLASSYLVSASQQGNSAYSLALDVIVQEDSWMEGTTNFRSNCGGASGKWSSITINSKDAAKLYMTFDANGVYTQCDIIVNANLVMTGDADSTAFGLNKGEATLAFEGGETTVTGKRLCSGGSRFVKFNGGSIEATLTDRVAGSEITAGNVTVANDICYTLVNASGSAIELDNVWKASYIAFDSHTHTPEEAADDGDCSTAITYSCGKVVLEAKQHTAGANNDCTKATPCANEGCTKDYAPAAATAHTPGTDDGDCTTAVKCANCEQEAVPAAANHAGGTATCTAKAKCAACGTEYGELAAHQPAAGTYSCDVAHPCANCTANYREAGQHIGGTATCQAKAKCTNCGAEYGELGACAPAADDGDCTTEIKCSLCGKTTTAGETAHKYTDKNDTTCDNAGCTNTRKVEGAENPKTGDNTALVLMVALMAVAATAFVTTKKFAR